VNDSAGVMASIFGLGGLLLIPGAFLLGRPLLDSSTTIAISLYLSVIAVAFAYWIFGIALTRVRASTATLITLVEPAVAAVLASAVVGEHIQLAGWAGVT